MMIIWDITPKERILLERIIRPILDSDYFDDPDRIPAELFDQLECDATVKTLYTKIEKALESEKLLISRSKRKGQPDNLKIYECK